jgi:hypothetical protein
MGDYLGLGRKFEVLLRGGYGELEGWGWPAVAENDRGHDVLEGYWAKGTCDAATSRGTC